MANDAVDGHVFRHPRRAARRRQHCAHRFAATRGWCLVYAMPDRGRRDGYYDRTHARRSGGDDSIPDSGAARRTAVVANILAGRLAQECHGGGDGDLRGSGLRFQLASRTHHAGTGRTDPFGGGHGRASGHVRGLGGHGRPHCHLHQSAQPQPLCGHAIGHGSLIGTKMALKNGNQFVRTIFLFIVFLEMN